ncbi:MAG TPA: SDR family NAD(P)-dependent oxidoreductase [Gemmatimonadaceae bacterium]|nr:SDR family NAD(P)-dependent oxidoreductase [Gemmatimonadaceae bacterium]
MTGQTQGRVARAAQRPVLITGGAGFVGCNLAHRLLGEGRTVVLFDNLSRAGVERNLAWLRAQHGDRVTARVADVRDRAAVEAAVRGVGEVYHFAAQVAVTTSLADPVEDFEINARGTLNLLEAIRAQAEPPSLVFTSTNKVYGELADLPTRERDTRHEPTDELARARGVSERRSLDFHSPYGCSKGTADQYVLDYARSFGIPAVVFRMSCIYGPHQFGTEDQGWVAHFLIRAIEGAPIALYGDGKQVRDVLFVEDLIDAFLLARRHIHAIAGRAFNIGGGAANTTSLNELLARISELTGERPAVTYGAWRTGDQRWYVSDVRAFGEATGWVPRTTVADGLARLHAWLRDARAESRVAPRASAVASAANTQALAAHPLVQPPTNGFREASA